MSIKSILAACLLLGLLACSQSDEGLVGWWRVVSMDYESTLLEEGEVVFFYFGPQGQTWNGTFDGSTGEYRWEDERGCPAAQVDSAGKPRATYRLLNDSTMAVSRNYPNLGVFPTDEPQISRIYLDGGVLQIYDAGALSFEMIRATSVERDFFRLGECDSSP